MLCVCELYVYVVFQVRLRHRNSQGLLATAREEWENESQREREIPRPPTTKTDSTLFAMTSFGFLPVCMRVDEVTWGDSSLDRVSLLSISRRSLWSLMMCKRHHQRSYFSFPPDTSTDLVSAIIICYGGLQCIQELRNFHDTALFRQQNSQEVFTQIVFTWVWLQSALAVCVCTI